MNGNVITHLKNGEVIVGKTQEFDATDFKAYTAQVAEILAEPGNTWRTTNVANSAIGFVPVRNVEYIEVTFIGGTGEGIEWET